MKIAIDIGYGHTKVKTDILECKFPTAIEIVKTQWIETENYSFEGKKFYVGDDATRNALPTRDYEFLYKYSPLLIIEALKKPKLILMKKLLLKLDLAYMIFQKVLYLTKDFPIELKNLQIEFQNSILMIRSITLIFNFLHKGKVFGKTIATNMV